MAVPPVLTPPRFVDFYSRIGLLGGQSSKTRNRHNWVRKPLHSAAPCATVRLPVKCPGFQSLRIFFSACILSGVILHGAALRRYCHRRRPQRACECRLPCQSREEGACARTAACSRWSGRHRGNYSRFSFLRVFLRGLAASARDHSRAGSSAPRARNPSTRRYVHAHGQWQPLVAHERSRAHAARNSAALAR
jgi:hypothetical protein